METEFEVDRQETLDTAKRMLAGEIDLLDGCHLIVGRLGRLGLVNDPVIVALVGIDSECDELPGRVGVWALSSRAAIDAERNRYIEVVRSVLIEACEAIVSQLEPSQSP